MEVTVATSFALSLVLISIIVRCAWGFLDWVWLKPKKLERCLRQQGFKGNSYRLLYGDVKEIAIMLKEAKSKPINLSTSHDIAPRVTPLIDQSVKTYGKNSFVWIGPKPRVNITNPEDLKDVFTKLGDFPKPVANPLFKLLATGLVNHEGEKWAKHRRIINPTFHLEKLKRMLPAFFQSCNDMTKEWERFVPTKMNKRMKQIDTEIRGLLMGIIRKREQAIEAGEATKDDLLGALMESNLKDGKNNKNGGMSMEDVIEECKLFYFAGQETTSVLLVWTMVLLCQNQNWQDRAREEVLQVFGMNKPDFDGLTHLKVVTMILLEVLRLYPAGVALTRTTHKKTQLGKFSLPAGVEVGLPTLLIHQDKELWGDDAKEFKPERFSEGVSKATKNQLSFFPFGAGPRICIGQNFVMTEAKLALALILQHFTFELSPSYAHAPSNLITLLPQFGAPIILHKR